MIFRKGQALYVRDEVRLFPHLHLARGGQRGAGREFQRRRGAKDDRGQWNSAAVRDLS